jgi:hypothetical protein
MRLLHALVRLHQVEGQSRYSSPWRHAYGVRYQRRRNQPATIGHHWHILPVADSSVAVLGFVLAGFSEVTQQVRRVNVADTSLNKKK